MPKETETARNSAVRQTATIKQYHPSVLTEEESWSTENVGAAQICTGIGNKIFPSTTSALVVYGPVPILKITRQDIECMANTTPPADTLQQFYVLLLTALITLAQCRMALLENPEKLEHDTPIPSIEPYESRDFATSKVSPQHDRLRSMSGSTVAESMPQAELLSLSAISTVYSLGMDSDQKEVRWAEKRVSEDMDAGTSPKRPKLSDYKQVGSGRVATLMDRFEKFHL
ncbi:hypothetical protein E8E12_006996 [Didymella heteroderae]|uniref:Uncharacterized protein n=1 Tax=Didymella heteroderae TaxID=1769908 RepID=A0A9P4WS42_9PLEO|nr:hypothetical protein E8E12_006996 [Didymella heteroderae]